MNSRLQLQIKVSLLKKSTNKCVSATFLHPTTCKTISCIEKSKIFFTKKFEKQKINAVDDDDEENGANMVMMIINLYFIKPILEINLVTLYSSKKFEILVHKHFENDFSTKFCQRC